MLLRRNKFIYNQFLKILKKSFPDRFRIAKLTKIPKIGRLIEYMTFEDDYIYYLTKDEAIENNSQKTGSNTKTVNINKSLTTSNSNLSLPSDVIYHFIDEAEYLWKMDFCICRVSANCEEYSQSLGCLFLGEASMDIDPDLGRVITKEEARDHIKNCSDSGLVHLAGRNKLDTVWLDIGPGNKLMTVCNCCECCCLWKMIPKLDRSISEKVQPMSGLKVEINQDLCIECGDCASQCFVEAIKYDEEKKEYFVSSECRACGRCITNCVNDAIEIKIQNKNYISETINNLGELIDVK